MNKLIIRTDADLQDLVPGYLSNRHKDIVQIEACLADGDFETVRRLAHRMKGSGGGYGFDGITDVGAAMEQAAIRKDVAEVNYYLELLMDYLNRVEVIYV